MVTEVSMPYIYTYQSLDFLLYYIIALEFESVVCVVLYSPLLVLFLLLEEALFGLDQQIDQSPAVRLAVQSPLQLGLNVLFLSFQTFNLFGVVGLSLLHPLVKASQLVHRPHQMLLNYLLFFRQLRLWLGILQRLWAPRAFLLHGFFFLCLFYCSRISWYPFLYSVLSRLGLTCRRQLFFCRQTRQNVRFFGEMHLRALGFDAFRLPMKCGRFIVVGLFGIFDVLNGFSLALRVVICFAIDFEDLDAESKLFRDDSLLRDDFAIIFFHGSTYQRQIHMLIRMNSQGLYQSCSQYSLFRINQSQDLPHIRKSFFGCVSRKYL